MTEKITPYDGSDYINTKEEVYALLEESLKQAYEYNEPELIIIAIGDIARSKGMAQIAKENNLNRESLYKALSSEGNPSFITIMKVLRSLGISLHTQTA